MELHADFHRVPAANEAERVAVLKFFADAIRRRKQRKAKTLITIRPEQRKTVDPRVIRYTRNRVAFPGVMEPIKRGRPWRTFRG